MKLILPTILLLAIVVIGCTNAGSSPASNKNNGVTVVHREDKKKVDVFIDDVLFTSYLFSEQGSSLKKPVLYPLRTANGNDITRGYPYEKRSGERVDHPHHVGHWLNYGDVNGLDFWNHSDSSPESKKPRLGTIVHRNVLNAASGKSKGVLEVETEWLKPDGSVILTERTLFTFKKGQDKRMIDRKTTLTAPTEPVSFTDNKEGMVAIRVTRALEHPAKDSVLLTNDEGLPRPAKEMDNTGVSGQYLSSEGISGVNVWGTRAEWMILSGIIGDENVTVAIIDHPANPGYPTYWHARGYGLFAANPLGQKVFSKGEEELNFALASGESVTFRHRIAILSNSAAPSDTVSSLSKAFSESL